MRLILTNFLFRVHEKHILFENYGSLFIITKAAFVVDSGRFSLQAKTDKIQLCSSFMRGPSLHLWRRCDRWTWLNSHIQSVSQCFPKVPTADGFCRLLDIWLSATLIEGSLLSIRLFEFWKSDQQLQSYSRLKISTLSKWSCSEYMYFTFPKDRYTLEEVSYWQGTPHDIYWGGRKIIHLFNRGDQKIYKTNFLLSWLIQMLLEFTISRENSNFFLGGGPPNPPPGLVYNFCHLTTLYLDVLYFV